MSSPAPNRVRIVMTAVIASLLCLTGLAGAHADVAEPVVIKVASPHLNEYKTLEFPNTEAGTPSDSLTTRTVTVSSLGDGDLTISDVEIKGYGSADYTITSNCLTTLPRGHSCSIDVKFAPSFDGVNLGALVITSNATSADGSTPEMRQGGISFIYVQGLGYGLCDNPFPEGDGVDVPFVITTNDQFNCINATDEFGSPKYLDKDFVLGADLNAQGTAGELIPVGVWDYFTGTFDGRGHTITGFTVDDVWAGLFMFPDGAHIKNLDIEDADVTSMFEGGIITAQAGGTTFEDITISGGSMTGTLGNKNGGAIGDLNNSTVERVSSSATVTVTVQENAAQVGGLIGLVQGGSRLLESYSTGSVSVTVEPPGHSTPDGLYVGGLVGQAQGASVVSDSYATGSVSLTNANVGSLVGGLAGRVVDTGTTVTRSYSSGSVTASEDGAAQGFVGAAGAGTSVSDSYWNKETSGQATDGAAPETTDGLTSQEMGEVSAFTSWAIRAAPQRGAVWTMPEAGPPVLSWTLAPTLSPASQTLTGTVNSAVPATSALSPLGLSSPVSYTVAPALPVGLTLDTTTGVVSGTPSVTSAAAVYTITGTDASSRRAQATLNITVAAAPTPIPSGAGTSESSSQPPAANPPANPPAPSRATEPVAPVSNPVGVQQTYRQPVAAQRLTSTVTLVPAELAASTPTRTVRKEPSPTIGSAPTISVTLNQPVKLLVQGFTAGAAYVVQMKSSTGYVVLGTVVANAKGQLELPVFRNTRPTETTIAIVASTGKASYIKVNAATRTKKVGAGSPKLSTASGMARTAGSTGRR